MNMLEIQHLRKDFGSKKVIRDVSFSIPENTIFGFVGENGAGKTTTMKMILGLLEADGGTIKVNSETVYYGNTGTNKYIGYLPDVPEFYSYMTPREYLMFSGQIAGVRSDEQRSRVDELLELVGLYDEKHRIKGFSRGMKQRLGIAQALIQRPKLLICDEPTSALDPIGRKQILDVLVAAKKETTVLFSTHILSDVERICDELAFLHDGEIVLSGKISDIKDMKKSVDYEIVFNEKESADKLIAAYQAITGLDDYSVRVKCTAAEDIFPIISYISENNIRFDTIRHCESTLENMFLEVAGK